MVNIGDKVLVVPDGSGGYIVRTMTSPTTGAKTLLVPTGDGGVVAAPVGEAVVGARCVVSPTGEGQHVVLMSEPGAAPSEPGPEGEPAGSFYLVSMDPAPGSTNVPNDKTITLTFNHYVYPPTVLEKMLVLGTSEEDYQIKLLDYYGDEVAVFRGVNDKTVSIDPVSSLSGVYGHYEYTVWIRRNIRDLAGNLLYKEYTKTFTVKLVNSEPVLVSSGYSRYITVNPLTDSLGTFDYVWDGAGQVYLSGSPTGLSNTGADDEFWVYETSTPTNILKFSGGSTVYTGTPNITSILHPGLNHIHIDVYSDCLYYIGCGPVYIIRV